MKRHWELTIHGIILGIFLFLINYPEFDLTFGVFSSGDLSLLWPSVVGALFNAILFYGIIYYLVPHVLRKSGVWRFILTLILVFFLVTFFEILVDAYFARQKYGIISANQWAELTAIIVFGHVLILIIALAYKFVQDWLTNERLQRSINEWKLQSELDLLKSQINPHFLFNALNSLFSMALQNKDENTAEGISKLSEMMRYVFDRSGNKTVSLEDEIKYIEDYIYMQLLRFGERVEVNFIYPEEGNQQTVVPMLFIPFVENAFKYGVASNRRTSITIEMKNIDDEIQFHVLNEIVEQNSSIPSTGIGIDNVKKRLALTYPEKHSISTLENNGKFEVNLTLKAQ